MGWLNHRGGRPPGEEELLGPAGASQGNTGETPLHQSFGNCGQRGSQEWVGRQGPQSPGLVNKQSSWSSVPLSGPPFVSQIAWLRPHPRVQRQLHEESWHPWAASISPAPCPTHVQHSHLKTECTGPAALWQFPLRGGDQRLRSLPSQVTGTAQTPKIVS